MSGQRHRVECDVEDSDVENDHYILVPGVTVMCGRCGHHTESSGRGTASVKRCLARLRDTCPESERNWYVAIDEDGLEII